MMRVEVGAQLLGADSCGICPVEVSNDKHSAAEQHHISHC